MRISDWSSDVCSSDLRTGFDFAQPLLRMDGSGNIAPMIRGFLTRRAEWPARIADPDALPPLTLLWREVGSLARAIGGRIRPLPPEPNPDSDPPPEIGRAHVWTPVNNGDHAYRLLL